MEEAGKVGIGTVVMRNEQYLGAVRPLDGALALSTMRFADEVVPQADVEANPAGAAKPDKRELGLATQIIDSLATEWQPERYTDTYTDQLRDLLERKAKGEQIVIEEEGPSSAKVVDLMEALEASLAAARKGGGGKPAAKTDNRPAGTTRKSAAKKKAAAQKAPAKKKPPAEKAPAKKAAKRKSA